MIEKKIAGECPRCKKDKFEQPPNPKPDDQIRCVACGHRFKAKEAFSGPALKEAKDHAEKAIRKAFGKLGGKLK